MPHWAKTRKQGQLRFVFIFGAVLWGLPSALFTWAYLNVKYAEGDSGLAALSQALPSLPVYLLSFGVVGCFFGRWIWRSAEQRYLKAQET